MQKILITGATGNVGRAVIEYLFHLKVPAHSIAGVRNIDKAKSLFTSYNSLDFIPFDFEDSELYENAFKGINTIFLLRPPHISNIDKYFKPLIAAIQKSGINRILFLSVQGAEKSGVIPHNKIEKLIVASGLDHIFIRPSYFMQNLTTTLQKDIKEKREIILPAGKAKFNWIDVQNIGEACARLLVCFDEYKNQAIEITGDENASFGDVVDIVNKVIATTIRFHNLDPISYFFLKKKEGVIPGMIIVMILLHFLPRFQKEPAISKFYEKLTGKKPVALREFIEKNKDQF